jgi:hypothetical protein
LLNYVLMTDETLKLTDVLKLNDVMLTDALKLNCAFH